MMTVRCKDYSVLCETSAESTISVWKKYIKLIGAYYTSAHESGGPHPRGLLLLLVVSSVRSVD